MTTTAMSCSWCHKMNVIGPRPTFCGDCEHRADLPRMECDCAKCRRHESPKLADGGVVAVGDLVMFDEPYDGFAGGVVAELLRGVLGPIAGVKVAPGRTVDTLCRRLRRAT